jgi:hypothetical protein
MVPVFIFLMLNWLTGWSAYCLAQVALNWSGADPQAVAVRRWPTTLLFWFVLIHGIMLSLGLLGLLQLKNVIIVTVGLALLSTWLHWQQRIEQKQPIRIRQKHAALRTGQRGVWLGLSMLFVFSCVWFYMQFWLHIQELTFDDLVYYASTAVQWLKQGSLEVQQPWTYKSYYPLSTNLIPMWLMLAWPVEQLRDAMTWTSLNGLLIASWGAVVINEILRRSKVQLQYRILAIVLVFSNIRILEYANGFCEPDLAIATMILGALAFVLPTQDQLQSPRLLHFDRGLAALCLGLALGIRPTALFPGVVIVGITMSWEWIQTKSWQRVLLQLVLWGVGFLVTGAGWYLRNLWLYGNPVYPAQVLGLPGVTNFPNSRLTELAGIIGWSRTLQIMATNFFQWYFLLAPLCCVALLGWCYNLLRVKHLNRQQSWIVYAIGLVLVVGITYPTQPFSGGYSLKLLAGKLDPEVLRYLLFLIILGVIAFCILLQTWSLKGWQNIAVLSLLYAGAIASSSEAKSVRMLIAASCLCVIGLIWWGSTRFRRALVIWIPRRILKVPVFVPVVCVLLSCLVVIRHSSKARASLPKFNLPVETAIDQLPAGSRLSLISSGGWLPAFTPWGNHLQHQLVLVQRDGTPSAQPIPEIELLGLQQFTPPQISPQQFTANLRNSGVEYLVLEMFFGFEEADRLLPHSDWLRNSGEAELLTTDPRRELWKILPAKK